MELLLQKLDEKLEKQAENIMYSVTKNVMEALDEKMRTIMTRTLKQQIERNEKATWCSLE